MRSNRTSVVSATLALVLATLVDRWILDDGQEFLAVPFFSNSVVFDNHVNQTEREVCLTYGIPDDDRAGYQPLGTEQFTLPRGRIRTLVFHKRAGLNGRTGTVRVWLVQRRRGWVCFHSVWFGDNVCFG